MILFLAILAFIAEPDARKSSVTLSWDLNPPEQNIAEYRLYCGRKSGVYDRVIETPFPPVVVSLPGGKATYFTATAVNMDGVEGDLGNEIHYP